MSIHDRSLLENLDETLLAGAVFSRQPKSMANGLVAGTKVETERGWMPVESIRQGQRVWTFDGGLRPLKRLERTVYGADFSASYPDGLLMVPGGAIDNCNAVYLLPDQHVLLESPIAERVLGRPAVLVPAAALEGYNGIQRVMPVDIVDIVALIFDEEEVVYTNTGTMVHCPTQSVDRRDGGGTTTSAFFHVLTRTEAMMLLAKNGFADAFAGGVKPDYEFADAA